MRVATIDIGTNSVLLLIAQTTEGSANLEALCERSKITRLGQGVDRTRALHPEAVERTLSCLRDYAGEIARFAPDRIEAVSTSAARDASGASAFIDAAASILGVAPRVITGEHEAELTFMGALSGLDVQGPVAVVDIGGGSTEIVRGAAYRAGLPVLSDGVSVNVGSVRLTERHLVSDPPTDEEMRAVEEHVWTSVRGASVSCAEATWVGIGGTVTTLASVRAGLQTYDARVVHGSTLSRSDVVRLREQLASVPLLARAATPGLDPKRADIIVAGAVIVETLQKWAGVDRWMVSDRGVRWGLALTACCTR